MTLGAFDTFVAVDWTGAVGRRHPGIAVALAEPGRAAPRLIWPDDGGAWSRAGVLAWLGEVAAGCRLLVGFDFSFSLPFVDLGAYAPGLDGVPVPSRARDLWAWLDALAAGTPGAEDLGPGTIASDGPLAAYFLTRKPAGRHFQRRFRLTEHLCREGGQGNAQCVFHLIGPNQVGKASLAGMRLLHRLDGVAVWPFDRVRAGASVAVEIYTGLCIRDAGLGQRKVADHAGLAEALSALASDAVAPDGGAAALSDHGADALIGAAWLRARAGDAQLWRPRALSAKVRRAEGWTFGVV
ncbi:hypothetical protein CCR85_13940 [Rhodothalassium salexigens]|uniref:hypothetical protein n=1 Tax=Rhodothalassium salexigens TaxID=1086 RepID=UPI0019127E17|nr:hypothetical protein [Rhodothalassium salexigens]MBK5912587.1 hypothetical protein [Rhodothalassium salexigens]